ncbi:MAG: aldehyde ferredoxin oxidoreductase family protein [Sulfolobales archaeon]|nr:aldehyde ferredoxin oxidoreductase family protein [Sulfolobales archaeon]MCX8186026.1 aldehyde ferredoxin oxidoreductase family protein [Sulfolobales archaeon]MDW7969321.1 aldehyde ferredoxin oxidoreductase family protein [Sulfolobales archaeon]
MPGGYIGKIARVNLWNSRVSCESLCESTLMKWIGGRGLGVYLALKEIPPKADPFGPLNKAYVMTGPLTGILGVPASGRWCSVTKSPLTNTIHDAQSGGKFGPYLKFAGFDAIVLEEVSQHPVYLWVHDGKVEIRDACHLWGADTHATTDAIVEELSAEVGKSEAKDIKVACIGPAGENLSRIACIINDKARAAGRGGHGAVWGSKKVKAIAVYGREKPPIANQSKFSEVVKEAMRKIKESPVTSESLPKYGTAILVNIINNAGIFPTRNFQTGVFPDARLISGETIASTTIDWEKQREEVCWGCPIGCARYSRITKPPFTGEGGGPEYETVWSFGAHTGVSDLAAVSKAHFLTNELGLDAISAGHVIGTLMELVQRGKVPEDVLRGLKVEWGNGEALVELVWRMAYRSGIGCDLAEGAKRLAEKYGAPELAMVVRGQELPAYDPRGVQGHGLAYATSNRGGCHLRAYLISPEVLGVPKLVDRFDIKDKGPLVKEFQDVFAVVDSLVVCKFDTFALWTDDFTKFMNAVTGWELSSKDLELIGERIYNAERVFNILSFGDGKEYDTLPKRLLEEPMPEGPSKGRVVKLDEMLNDYYKARGWINGRPTRAKLEELGLKWAADLLEDEGLLPG